MMALTWINGPIIRAGESLSEPVDLSGDRRSGILRWCWKADGH